MGAICGQSEDGASVLIVAGPTASGKSALAMELAARLGGVVINADSMQVYRELRVLTARPTTADEATVPHALYGVRPAAAAGRGAGGPPSVATRRVCSRSRTNLPGPRLCQGMVGRTSLMLRCLVA